MVAVTEEKRVLALLADLLDYPCAGLAGKAAECERLVARLVPAAGEPLSAFRAYLEATPLADLEETYSGFFDLNPLCHPYVGYHLFGETYKRSVFLVGLKKRYAAHGFSVDPAELPDRVSVMLRFVATSADETLGRELLEEGLAPALERMSTANKANHPPVEAPSCGPELEGHSHGDVLEGGYLLRMSEAEGDHNGQPHPYWQALRALHLFLSAAQARRMAAG
jgi:nitrate reductase delta subunit